MFTLTSLKSAPLALSFDKAFSSDVMEPAGVLHHCNNKPKCWPVDSLPHHAGKPVLVHFWLSRKYSALFLLTVVLHHASVISHCRNVTLQLGVY